MFNNVIFLIPLIKIFLITITLYSMDDNVLLVIKMDMFRDYGINFCNEDYKECCGCLCCQREDQGIITVNARRCLKKYAKNKSYTQKYNLKKCYEIFDEEYELRGTIYFGEVYYDIYLSDKFVTEFKNRLYKLNNPTKIKDMSKYYINEAKQEYFEKLFVDLCVKYKQDDILHIYCEQDIKKLMDFVAHILDMEGVIFVSM